MDATAISENTMISSLSALKEIEFDHIAIKKFYGTLPFEDFVEYCEALTKSIAGYISQNCPITTQNLIDEIQNESARLARLFKLTGNYPEWITIVRNQIFSAATSHLPESQKTHPEAVNISGLYFNRFIRLLSQSGNERYSAFLHELAFNIALNHPTDTISRDDALNELVTYGKSKKVLDKNAAADLLTIVTDSFNEAQSPENLALSRQNAYQMCRGMTLATFKSFAPDISNAAQIAMRQVRDKIMQNAKDDGAISYKQIFDEIFDENSRVRKLHERDQELLLTFMQREFHATASNPSQLLKASQYNTRANGLSGLGM
jgi:hypothetical protein